MFELNGVTHGINICFDTNFADAAAPLAAQGARLMLVSAQNMMKRGAAEKWQLLHNRIRAERVRETRMWLVSADVTGARAPESGERLVDPNDACWNPIADWLKRLAKLASHP